MNKNLNKNQLYAATTLSTPLAILALALTLSFFLLTSSLNAEALNAPVTCSQDSTEQNGVFTCIVTGNNIINIGVTPVTQNQEITLNAVEITNNNRQTPIQGTVNLLIKNANLQLPENTKLSFSNEKFKEITLERSQLQVTGDQSKLALNAIDKVNISTQSLLKAREVKAKANELIISSELKARSIELEALETPSNSPEFNFRYMQWNGVNIERKIVNLTRGFTISDFKNEANKTSLLISTNGLAVAQDEITINNALALSVAANSIDFQKMQFSGWFVNLNTVKNIKTPQINADNAITITSTQGDVQIEKQIISRIGKIKISAGRNVNVTLPQGQKIESSGLSRGLFNLNLNLQQQNQEEQQDQEQRPVEDQWKQKSSVVISAAGTLTIKGRINTGSTPRNSEARKTVNSNDLQRQEEIQGTSLELYNLTEGEVKGKIKVTSTSYRNGENVFGAQQGNFQCKLHIMKPQLNVRPGANAGASVFNVPTLYILTSKLRSDSKSESFNFNQLAENEQLKWLGVPLSLEFSPANNNCKVKNAAGQELVVLDYNGRTSTGEPLLILSKDLDRHSLPDSAKPTVIVEFTEVLDESVNTAFSLIADEITLENSASLTSSTGFFAKARSITSSSQARSVIPRNVLQSQERPVVISCNSNHLWSQYVNIALSRTSGLCPSTKVIHVYGSLEENNEKITSGSIKVKEIKNTATQQLVAYQFGANLQQWQAIYNNAFSENGAFHVTLGTGGVQNPEVIIENGRYEVKLLIDKQNVQFTCEETQNCIEQTATVNVQ